MQNEETIEDIVNAERDMVLHAEKVYGEYFVHAMNMVTLLNNMVGSIDKPERFIFVAFLSRVKKHITLALFSAVRRHHVEAGMNLRQVVENAAWAAYGMAHEDPEMFCTRSENGLVMVPEKLRKARDSWLTKHYSAHSDAIRELKKTINDTVAHANFAYALQTFSPGTIEQPGFFTTFFDQEDNHRVKGDLVIISEIALGMVNLFLDVNENEKIFKTKPVSVEAFQRLTEEHQHLREIFSSLSRFGVSVQK